MIRILFSLVAAVAAMVVGVAVHADAIPGLPSGSPHIAAELVVEGPVAPGGSVSLAVTMRPEPGWHGYWLEPGDAGYPFHAAWHLPPGARVGALQYPVPQTLLLAGLMNHVYERDYALLAPLTAPANAVPGSVLPIGADAEWLACSASICVPERAVLHAMLHVAAPGAAPGSITPSDPRFDGWRAALPAPLGAAAHVVSDGKRLRFAIPLPAGLPLRDPHLFVAAERVVDFAAPQTFARAGDVLVVSVARPTTGTTTLPASVPAVLSFGGDGTGPARGLALTATPGPVPSGGVPLNTASADAPHLPPLPVLLLAALAGGLLLNIMPCVFPILSLKALSLARSGESKAHARVEGLAYAAGVILACIGLGALLLGLRAGGEQIGWAFQLQEPGVIAVLLVLAVAITANLLGVYELAVPGFAQHHASRGAFATGLLAAFVATPCTGPFMASAMGAALLLPTALAMLLFASLGLGLALPFLAIAFVAPLRRLLPRPGAWMNWFRKALALPMALTALALAWLANRVGGGDFAAASVLTALVLLGLLAMVGWHQRRGRGVAQRFVPLAAMLAVAAVAVLPHTLDASHSRGEEDADLLPAHPFSDAALTQALASGHPVFAFFTADWCLTCKVNERLAIERASTRDAFARAGVVVLKGDWTQRDPAITRYLTGKGAAGVPLYVWYPGHEAGAGDKPAQVLPQVLTPDTLASLAR